MNKQVYNIGTKIYFYHQEKWHIGEIVHTSLETGFYIIGNNKQTLTTNPSQQLTTFLKFFNYSVKEVSILRKELLNYIQLRKILTLYGFPFEKVDMCSVKEFYLNNLKYT